jgi:hypothetical protein
MFRGFARVSIIEGSANNHPLSKLRFIWVNVSHTVLSPKCPFYDVRREIHMQNMGKGFWKPLSHFPTGKRWKAHLQNSGMIKQTCPLRASWPGGAVFSLLLSSPKNLNTVLDIPVAHVEDCHRESSGYRYAQTSSSLAIFSSVGQPTSLCKAYVLYIHSRSLWRAFLAPLLGLSISCHPRIPQSSGIWQWGTRTEDIIIKMTWMFQLYIHSGNSQVLPLPPPITVTSKKLLHPSSVMHKM